MSDAQEKYKADAPLVPIEQRVVDFYGDELIAVLIERDGRRQVYVPLRPICDYLGLDWSAQSRRLSRDEALGDGVISVAMMATEIGRGKGSRTVTCLQLKMLYGWLFGIEASRVKPELKEKIVRYRRECYDKLAEAFEADALASTNIQPQSDATTALLQVREIGRALMQMADQQLELQRRQEATDHKLDRGLNRAAIIFDELRERLSVVEARTAPETFITSKQAGQVKSHIEALAEHLTHKDNSQNWYRGIYTALYDHFGIKSFERIRKGQFEDVMAMLDGWRIAADTNRQLGLFDTPGGPTQS